MQGDDINLYEEALAQLTYIEAVKNTMHALLNRLVDVSQSNMLVSVRDYDCAVSAILEAIDEMYYDHARIAKLTKDSYSQMR